MKKETCKITLLTFTIKRVQVNKTKSVLFNKVYDKKTKIINKT